MSEEWRPVVGWEKYEVSNLGRVRRIKGKRAAHPYRVLRGFQKPAGYITVQLSKNGKISIKLVHRLVCEAFNGPSTAKHCAHLNGIPNDNRPENLCWATPVENERQKAFHGRRVFGEAVNFARLKSLDVEKIRALSAAGVSNAELARQFNIDRGHAWKITTGRAWREF